MTAWKLSVVLGNVWDIYAKKVGLGQGKGRL